LFHYYWYPAEQNLTQWWLWPLVSSVHSDDQRAWSLFWPLIWWREYDDPDGHNESQWVLPFFWRVVKEDKEHDREEFVKIWPLGHWTVKHDALGNRIGGDWSILSPWPWRDGNAYGVERPTASCGRSSAAGSEPATTTPSTSSAACSRRALARKRRRRACHCSSTTNGAKTEPPRCGCSSSFRSHSAARMLRSRSPHDEPVREPHASGRHPTRRRRIRRRPAAALGGGGSPRAAPHALHARHGVQRRSAFAARHARRRRVRGAILAMQTGIELRRFGDSAVLGTITALSMCREMGPFITGVILAATVGSSMAAELGTMKVSDEVAALEVMSVDPVDYLVLPRVIALAIMCPILTVLSNLVGMYGGSVIAEHNLGVSPDLYWISAREALTSSARCCRRRSTSVSSSPSCSAPPIATVSCASGLRATGGALGVGLAVQTAVRNSVILIIVLGFIVTWFFYFLTG
jgi:phospholipid/cholesterol/gamma-HCH transport system permease protein